MKRINCISFILLLLTGFVLLHFTGCGEEQKDEPGNETATTIRDIDGNVYGKITIGDQVWMTENLRTTKYNDGTDIPLVTDNDEWCSLTTPAYCWYENDDVTYKNPYGAIYNWYTVNTNKLCPTGWSVPTDEEWTELEIYLQNNDYNYNGIIDTDNDRETNNYIGKALAADTIWMSSPEEGSIGNTDYAEYRNKSGFTALPGGYRDGGTGLYVGIDQVGYYFSISEIVAYMAIIRDMGYSRSDVYRSWCGETNGFSVRCLKD
jgi:uncharacterized protein (TIGR02145 family)